MIEIQTLNTMNELKDSGFGHLRPRHGLKLLYWFAKKCIQVDDDKFRALNCNPEHGDFGFHLFENRYERTGKLLPDVNYKYYELGNLHKQRTDEMPRYIREYYTHLPDDSNMDRLIVSFNDGCFEDIYVTEHCGQSQFNRDATFHISKHLLISIRGLTLEDFLKKTDYNGKPGTGNLQPHTGSHPDAQVNMETISQFSNSDRIVEMPFMEDKRCFCSIL